MKKPIFVKRNIYHIYNRGTDKRKVFMDDQDYLRFIHDLFEFNNIEPALSSNVRFTIRNPSELNSQRLEVGLPNIEKREPRKLLVEIQVFCLMPNHYHLQMRQLVEGGIVKFMQKLGTGYTNYFNQKYERTGVLFQGKFKAVEVGNDAQLLHLPSYIHFNPVELVEPKWKEREIKNWPNAIKFLESYRWSSYLDYIGRKNFLSVTSREFITEIVGKPNEYKKTVQEWLKEFNTETIKEVTLE